MANGDTKTNQYLDIAANGARADLPTDTCCETRTQTLIRGVAERVIDVEEEVERLENNPDVVDIVATYADLEDYDTSSLTDKDIIRVLQDETHGGNSTYYRWNSATSQFDFVGEIAGGDAVKELTAADYNYPTNNPSRIAHWLLDPGVYIVGGESGVQFAYSSISSGTVNPDTLLIISRSGSGAFSEMLIGDNGSWANYGAQTNNGTPYTAKTGEVLTDARIKQTTGASTTDLMSQKAVTDALANVSDVKTLSTADYNWPVDNPTGVALWSLDSGWYAAPGITVFYDSGTSYGAFSDGGELFYVSKATTSTGASRIVKIGKENTVTVYSTQLNDGSRYSEPTKTVNVVQTKGNSTTNVMSQNATTSMIFADPATQKKIKIGANTFTPVGDDAIEIGKESKAKGISTVAIGSGATVDSFASDGVAIGAATTTFGDNAVAIGYHAGTNNEKAVALGRGANASHSFSVALGAGATTSVAGEINVGTGSTYPTKGYNGTNYRLITGVHDPVDAHDAATKGYVDANAGGGFTTLTTDDYNWNSSTGQTGTPNCVALWLLPSGIYEGPADSSIDVRATRTQDYSMGSGFPSYAIVKEYEGSNNRAIVTYFDGGNSSIVEYYSIGEDGTGYSTKTFPNVVQTTGTSTTGVMSQYATSKMIYPRMDTYHDIIGIRGDSETPDSQAGMMSVGIGSTHISRGANGVAIGFGSTVYAAGEYSIAIGNTAKTTTHSRAVALGNASEAAHDNSVAIGTNSKTTRDGEVNVGANASGRGYNNTNYRVIGGVHDGQLAQDAATVNQVNATIDAINTALNTNIPHIGAQP